MYYSRRQTGGASLVVSRLFFRLDVDIESFGIELRLIPKHASIGNDLQYQNFCLDGVEMAS